MVGAWCEVISALRLGRSAISSARRSRSASRSACTLRKVCTDAAKSLVRPRRTWVATEPCTINNDTAVSPAEVSSMAMRNLVLSRNRAKGDLPSPDKLVPRPMNCAEVYRVGRIFLQLLPQAKHVGVDGTGGGIVVVSPDFVEQLGPRNHSFGIVDEEAQHLEFLRSQRDQLARAVQFHAREVYFHIVESEHFDFVARLIEPAQSRTN